MGIGDNYRPDENYGPLRGEKTATVYAAYEGVSKTSGNDMITLEFTVANFSWPLRYYITAGERFNANMTEFFDAFGIPRSDFNYRSWIGKTGTVFLGEDEKGFAKIKRLVVKRGESHDITQRDMFADDNQSPPLDSYAGTEPTKEGIPF